MQDFVLRGGLDEQMLRSDLSIEHAKFTLYDTAMACSETNHMSDVSWEQFQLRIDGNIPVQEIPSVQVDCTCSSLEMVFYI